MGILRYKNGLVLELMPQLTAFYRVTVGTPVTRHPPYRSVREELPHTAPTSGNNAEISGLEKGVQFLLLVSTT